MSEEEGEDFDTLFWKVIIVLLIVVVVGRA
jgi:hypothetical protein